VPPCSATWAGLLICSAPAKMPLAGMPARVNASWWGATVERDGLVGQALAVPPVLEDRLDGAGAVRAGYLQHLAGERIEVLSAGSQPADQVNPAAVAAMAEDGIDIRAEQPKLLTDSTVQTADVVITMGCGDACPFYPGKRYEDWVLDDPAGHGLETVRPIRDQIRQRVEAPVAEIDAKRIRD
jgi:arsenate reductase